MNLLILLAYLFLGKEEEVVVAIEAKEAELMFALPKNAPQQEARKLVVEISIYEAGKFSAKAKDDQLAAF